MKIFISATQYNEIYSDSTGILITKKINEEVDFSVPYFLSENAGRFL